MISLLSTTIVLYLQLYANLYYLWLSLGYASRDMIIPDVSMVHGRMIVSAWDFGLDDVQDDAVRLLMHSVEVCDTQC